MKTKRNVTARRKTAPGGLRLDPELLKKLEQESGCCEKLKSEKLYLEKIINSVADPIFVKDRKHRWVLLNEAYCRFMGYKLGQLIGKSDYDFFPKAEADVFWEKDEIVFRQGRENVNEEKFTDSAGVTHVISTKKSRYTDKSGAQFIVGIIRDITDLRRAEEKILSLNAELSRSVEDLSAVNKELDAFSYSVAHDLKAPLRALAGFSEMLSKDHSYCLNEEGCTLLSGIARNSVRMSRMIDDFLKFAHISRQDISPERVDMDSLARSVADEIRSQPEAAARDIRFNFKKMPPAKADPVMMRQLWHNLLSNAVKFTRPRAEARIEAGGKRERNGAVYWVKDNGVGFDMAYSDKIFGVFRRLHKSGEFEGTGIGLALVQRIVSRHKGRVWANGSPGKGAEFYFFL